MNSSIALVRIVFAIVLISVVSCFNCNYLINMLIRSLTHYFNSLMPNMGYRMSINHASATLAL